MTRQLAIHDLAGRIAAALYGPGAAQNQAVETIRAALADILPEDVADLHGRALAAEQANQAIHDRAAQEIAAARRERDEAKGRTADSTAATLRHIARVRALLGEFAIEMIRRGERHDASKFDPVEKGPLDEMQALIEREGPAAYGTPEYKRRTALLGPMIAHHHANNSHHPEHYAEGVAGMDLPDLVEMFCDWKAASERGEEQAMSLTAACERYAVAPQLAAILRNTADRLGFPHK